MLACESTRLQETRVVPRPRLAQQLHYSYPQLVVHRTSPIRLVSLIETIRRSTRFNVLVWTLP